MFDEKIDIGCMRKKIEGFPEQIMASFLKGKSKGIVKKPENLVITGMGGSAIAGNLLADLLFGDSDVPIFVNRGYELPAFVNADTLLFVSSYSGNTEEVVSSLIDGIGRRAKIVVLTSNGKIGKIAEEEKLTMIKLPSGYPPRSALGFSFFSMLGLISDIFGIPFNEKHLSKLVERLISEKEKLLSAENEITKLARMIIRKIPVIYVSGRLNSVARRWQTQINENSKTFAHSNVIPESNHNEIVGLEFPKETVGNMFLIFLRSKYYENERIQKRFSLTEEILRDYVGEIKTIKAGGENKLEDMFLLTYKGDFLSYYLSLLLEVDPTPVERIDLLKNGLKQ